MSHSTITTYYYLSLLLSLVVGGAILIWWGYVIVKKRHHRIVDPNNIHIEGAAVKGIFYMMPGLLAFVVLSIPVLYFNYLLKQEAYCLEVIRTNQGIKKDDPDLLERCGALNIEELFERK